MAKHQVLFCPFCRESFEQLEACPEHELPLVPVDQLPASDPHDDAEDVDEIEPAQPVVAQDERVHGPLELRYGRGLVALGALLNASALALQLVRLEGAPMLRTFELARARPSLWTLGLVSFTALYALTRRRTPRALRGLRVLVPLLALISPATLFWVLLRVGPVGELGLAVHAVLLATLLMLYGGVQLGAPRSLVSRRA